MKIHSFIIITSLITSLFAKPSEKSIGNYEERLETILQYLNSDEARFHELYLIALEFYQKLLEVKLSSDSSHYSRCSLECYIAYLQNILEYTKLDNYHHDMILNKLEKLKILLNQHESNHKEFENAVYNATHSLGIDSILVFGIGSTLNTDAKIRELQGNFSKANSSQKLTIKAKIIKRKLEIIQEEIIKTKNRQQQTISHGN